MSEKRHASKIQRWRFAVVDFGFCVAAGCSESSNAPVCNLIKTPRRLLGLALMAALAACSSDPAPTAPSDEPSAAQKQGPIKDQGPWEVGDQIASGLANGPNIEILEVRANGEGDVCGVGKSATLKYVAMKADGTVMDPGDRPFTFRVGSGEAIKGWDVIVAKMRVGDNFTLTLPQDLAYGPSRGDLKFDMELLSFR